MNAAPVAFVGWKIVYPSLSFLLRVSSWTGMSPWNPAVSRAPRFQAAKAVGGGRAPLQWSPDPSDVPLGSSSWGGRGRLHHGPPRRARSCLVRRARPAWPDSRSDPIKRQCGVADAGRVELLGVAGPGRSSPSLELPVAALHGLDHLAGRDAAEVGVGRREAGVPQLHLDLV